MTTARDLIKGALRLINVVQANEEPTAGDVDISLEALNALMLSKSNELLNIHHITPIRFPFVPGQFVYKLGPALDDAGNPTGADWVTARPMRLEQAKMMLNPDFVPVDFVGDPLTGGAPLTVNFTPL